MNYIITKNKRFFEKIGDYNYCDLDFMFSKKVKTIAVDTETTGLIKRWSQDGGFSGDRVFCVQIGTGEDNFIIDMQRVGKDYTINDVIPYLQDKTLVFHNSIFDLRFFYEYGFYPKIGQIQDTMLMSQILYNGKPWIRHSFGECMGRELNQWYDKTEQKNIWKVMLSQQSTIEYSFNDVDRLIELGRKMGRDLQKVGSYYAYSINADYARTLAYMEMCGLPVSIELWKKKMAEDLEMNEVYKQRVADYIYDNLPKYRDDQIVMFEEFKKKIYPQVSSAKQMIPVFKDLGINIINSEGKESLNKDVVKQTTHEFRDLWIPLSENMQDISTYGKNVLKFEENGRLYSNYRPILDTCRISTRGGFNSLNMTANERTRRCIRAKEGWKILGADYSGQETVTNADITEDPVLVSSIVNGDCLHCAFARVLFPELKELTDKEIKTNHSGKRKESKAPRFCFQYGGTAFTLQINTGKPIEECEFIEKSFKELHHGIFESAKKTAEEAMKKGYIENSVGFKLYLPYYKEFLKDKEKYERITRDDWTLYKEGKQEYLAYKDIIDRGEVVKEPKSDAYKLYRQLRPIVSGYAKKRSRYTKLAMNNPSQSLAAFISKLAGVYLFDEIVANGDMWKALICTMPHDEYLMEVKEDIVEKYKKILEDCMVKSGEKLLSSGLVHLEAEAEIGDDWYDVH